MTKLCMSPAFISATPVLQALRPSSFSKSVCKQGAHPHASGRAAVRPSAVHMSQGGAEASPTAVSITTQPTQQKSPAKTFESVVTAGENKANMPWDRTFILSIVAGAYIALGGVLALRVGGAVPGVLASNPGLQRLLLGLVGLPTGLTFVLATGGELFTGNTMMLTSALLAGRVKVARLLQNWGLSFLGNLLGSLLVVKLVLACGVLSVGGPAAGMAAMKVGLGFKMAFWRGVVCNWLVCLAVYMSSGAGDLVSKFVAIVLPISAFVAMGMEHSVANMFFIPMGMKLGAEVSVKQFLVGNLLPVTLGNIFGGAVLVALVYYLAFGRK